VRVDKGRWRHRQILGPWTGVRNGFTVPGMPAHAVVGVLFTSDCDGWFIGVRVGVGAHGFRGFGSGGRICGLDVGVEMGR
jgi:hypothetical protein